MGDAVDLRAPAEPPWRPLRDGREHIAGGLAPGEQHQGAGREMIGPGGIDEGSKGVRFPSPLCGGGWPARQRGSGEGSDVSGRNATVMKAGAFSWIVVDLSRHMNRILAINPVRGTARVEAGVVKDQLNAALAEYGLFFAP
ncbi:FAD-binding oxidoreductase, partial [Methylobacterium sp. E-065]|uniref:FAD-binding oxidoreductase n=1 Tax=Methylobacterium sp. E-065 TaxID=2836583 RepID=UPI00391D7D1E